MHPGPSAEHYFKMYFLLSNVLNMSQEVTELVKTLLLKTDL